MTMNIRRLLLMFVIVISSLFFQKISKACIGDTDKDIQRYINQVKLVKFLDVSEVSPLIIGMPFFDRIIIIYDKRSRIDYVVYIKFNANHRCAIVMYRKTDHETGDAIRITDWEMNYALQENFPEKTQDDFECIGETGIDGILYETTDYKSGFIISDNVACLTVFSDDLKIHEEIPVMSRKRKI